MRGVAVALMAVLWAASAFGRTEADIAMSSDAQAKIAVSCCFDNVTMPGYAPIDVTINNHSGETRQWVFQFGSPAYSYGSTSIHSSFTVSVENNGTRTVPLLVPTEFSQNGQMPLSVQVSGYGTEPGGQQVVGGRSWSGKTATPFAVMSESLGTSIWSDLSSKVDRDGQDLMGSTVNPDELPENWLALCGVAGIWLSGDELNHLTAAQRNAVQTWVHAGGWLMLCGVAEVPADFRDAGFGEVQLLPAKIEVGRAKKLIENDLPKYGHEVNETAIPQAQEIIKVKPNVLLLFSFMGVFAVVVGPLNVFGIARRRRERLFWTTPAISLCASGLLMGMIVAQDGLGGHGVRNAVVCVFPGSRNEVILQEQISRAGLLLGSGFQTRDPVFMRLLDDPASASTTGITIEKSRSLENQGTTYGGEWFASRAGQGHRIVAVEPTRAEITLLNGADARDKGEAPVVLSSFATTLDSLIYLDDAGRLWEGKQIGTGQKQTLKMISKAGGSPGPVQGMSPVDWHLLYGTFTYLTKPEIDRLLRKGSFMASSIRGADYVETLGSIRWGDEPVTYTGPVTVNP